MPLPKIVTPTYELTLPSNKKTIKYRPFLVKEEKVLILSMESGDPIQITNSVKNILKDWKNNQIYTLDKINTMPFSNADYIVLATLQMKTLVLLYIRIPLIRNNYRSSKQALLI